mmetsp:Transcript_12854/g.24413  ORF Transcript_12854/g.24413 Transcript_12854/m.24413 type:complete len:345 (-) Transcript_12854:98-1132(-)|eukprot:scaffold15561_cov179-Amphora_coffeaeformis.AAC.6
MGQSASSTATTDSRRSHPGDTTTTTKSHGKRTPQSPLQLLAVDIFSLNSQGLKTLLHHRPLTAHEIQQYARAESPIRSKEKAEASGLHFYSQSKDKESSSCSSEMDLAIRLCQIPHVSQLRFQLVPSRLKEDVFWQATFSCLKERLVDYNAKQQYGLADDDNEKNDLSPTLLEQHGGTTTPDEVDHEKELVHATTAVENHHHELRQLRKQVQSQNAELVALRQQIKELKQQQQTCKNGIHNGVVTTTHHASHPHHGQPHYPHNKSHAPRHTTTHKGQWKMDADSQEFLQFPADVKESLRKEKQRRLAQVQQEMKFILDGDELHHTHGHWDCCGNTSYHAASCGN